MGDTRDCEQCGTVFTPRREHARFCSVLCRVAWNSEHAGDPATGVTALQWSITAMKDTAERLPGVSPGDQPRAYAVIGEAVWWITIVDATLVRHHQEAYDGVLAGQAATQRRVIDEILAGLRFVRNRIGDEADLAEFIDPGTPGSGAGDGPVTDWAWKPVPEPVLISLAPRAQAWEMTRYRAYQAQLAGHPTGEIFGQAVAFLTLAAANATAIPDMGVPAAPPEARSAGSAART